MTFMKLKLFSCLVQRRMFVELHGMLALCAAMYILLLTLCFHLFVLHTYVSDSESNIQTHFLNVNFSTFNLNAQHCLASIF